MSGFAPLQVLQHSGRILSDQTQLQSVADLKPWSTLNLSYRMLGGGGDGGSTGAESRSSYLEMYMEKKPDKVNPAEELLAKWTCCHLSNEPLCAPCVVDELGYVYNKEAVLHNLLNKTMPPQLSYISGLKHLTELKLEANSKKVSTSASSSKASNAASFQLSNGADFACPVTGLEYNGRSKFVVLRPSGIVVSEKALKELLPVVEEMAGGKWSEEDVLPINPTGEQLQLAHPPS